ncbi:cytochrome C peroxidase [Shewanella sp. KX20019]|uniref:cytochrome c peroxidase n=1 Tax=Shewanella sp. KX20019 TaxID=2803864 RepID=UPI001927BAF2|nr:cytochrome c peroxidase [Shewanella sp. KX20019]QQX78904.1 cytochrome C peroxidase [Shewanella sp. KX20019]
MNCKQRIISVAIVAAMAAPAANANIDEELQVIISNNGLTGDPAAAFNLPAHNDPEVKLGKMLFFSQALGGEQTAACASCHHPYLGGGDGLALAVGVDAENIAVMGQGRKREDNVFNNPRNTPSVFNAFVWTQGVFWDSRVEQVADGIRTPDSAVNTPDINAGDNLLMAQAGFPVTSVEEMRTETFEIDSSNQEVRDHLASRLANIGIGANELAKNQWRGLFEAVYGSQTPDGGDVVNFDNVKRSIASYESSINLTDNPWFRYIKGDINAISESAKRGAKLFYDVTPGAPGCSACHSGDTFTNQAHFNVGFPQIGPGKGHGTTGVGDLGRGAEHPGRANVNSFRTPTLLNVAKTAPYGHAGAYSTLEQVIDHYDNIDTNLPSFIADSIWCEQPQFAAADNCEALFSASATDIAQENLAEIQFFRDLGISAVLPLGLSTQEKVDLLEFLHTLTDPCTENAECLQKWLPDPAVDDPDGLQLRALNAQGVPLNLTRECTQVNATSGTKLTPNDQMVCVSGDRNYFSIDIAEDDTWLYISTTGGSGNANIFFDPFYWATPENSIPQHRAIGPTNEEVLVVKAHSGVNYITLASMTSFELAGLTVSIGQDPATIENPVVLETFVTDACLTPMTPRNSGNLQPLDSFCVSPGGLAYFTTYIDSGTTQLQLRTDHGAGDVKLYGGPVWPTATNYQDKSDNVGNTEEILIENPTLGWYYVMVDANSVSGMSLRMDKKIN